MRRPRTSKLCVSSLLLFLLAWLIGTLVNVIVTFTELPKGWSIAGSAIMVLLMVASVILAISGLVVIAAQQDRYNQGKKQAIWALVLSGGMVLIMLATMVAGTVMTQLGDVASSNRQEMTFDQLQDHPDHNFRLAKPSGDWRKVDASAIMPTAGFVYSCLRPERYFACIAEDNTNLSRDEIKEIGVTRMKAMASSWKELESTTEVKGNLKFTRLRCKVQLAQPVNVELFYESWYACTTKHAYQFIFWTTLSGKARLQEDAAKWMSTFSLIKSEPEAQPAGLLTDGEFIQDGYAIELGAAGWRTQAEAEFPAAQLRARNVVDYLALVCLPLPGGVEVRAADLDQRLLATMQVGESDRLKGPEETTHSGVSGRRYRFTRIVEKVTVDFEVKVLQKDQMVWMLVVWGNHASADSVRKNAAACIRLFTPDSSGKPALPMASAAIRERSMILNDLALACYKRQDYRQAELLFRVSYQLQPEDHILAGNVIDALQQMGKQDAAITALNEMMAIGPLAGLPAMKIRLAQAYSLAGNNDKALQQWDQIFANGYANEDHFLEWINLLMAQNREKDALTAVEKYSKSQPSPRVKRWHASILGRNDRWDEAISMLAPATEGPAPAVESLYLLGEIQNDAGHYEDAEKTAGRLVAVGEETSRAWLILGWSEWHRKQWKSAREAFEKAAGKSPDSPVVKEALAMTAGAMGQGVAEVSRTPLEPVLLPAAVRELIAAQPAPPESLTKGHGAILLERHTGYYFETGKPSRVTQTYRVNVVDNTGVEAYSTLAITFYPASEKIHVNSLTVKDETGKLIQEGSSADAYTTADNGDTATGASILRVPVPGLRRGCTLEATITVEDKGKSTKAPFHRDLLVGGFPALARAWYFTGSPEAWKFATAPGLRAIKGPNSKSYVIFNTRAYRGEGFMPALEDWQPWGMAGPVGEDWKTIASDYLKRIADRLAPDDSTIAVWESLQKGTLTPEEKLGVIVRHVQSSLTYKGLEFGTRAMVPSQISKIQTDHYGDCKDHTLLLYHLLRRAGIPCHPALVDTGWKLRPELPSLEQFNHMILFVPQASRQPWLDATDEWLDLTTSLPESLAGRQALVLDPERPRFEKLGEATPSLIRIERSIASAGETDIRVNETLTLSGAAASWARSWLLSYPASEHSGLIRRQLDRQGNFTIEAVSLGDAEDRSKPFTIQMTYVASNAIEPEAATLHLPCFWECDYLSMSPIEDRQSPFLQSPSLSIRSFTHCTGDLSHFTAPASLAEAGKSIGSSWKLGWTSQEGSPGFEIQVDLPHGQHPPEKWQEFQTARRTLVDRVKRLTLVKSPP